MYTERQHFITPWQRSLRALCLALIIAQTAAFAAAETGLPWLPLGVTAHLCILVLAGFLFALLWQAGLTLRVSAQGLSWRFSPWQWRFQQLRWSEIRSLRLLPAGQQPPGARFGLPMRDFTHVYLLSSPKLQVLNIELVNNTQLFVTTERPTEMLDYLQHGIVGMGSKYVMERR